MRRAKRVWIYAGLGVPEGAALVRCRESLPRAVDGRRVLLVGGDETVGLVPPMTRLVTDTGGSLRVEHRAGTETADWARGPWLPFHLEHYDPTVVFLVASPTDQLSAKRIRHLMKARGVPLFWMVRPGVALRSDPRVIPARDLTASGYAAWAGQAWSMVE